MGDCAVRAQIRYPFRCYNVLPITEDSIKILCQGRMIKGSKGLGASGARLYTQHSVLDIHYWVDWGCY